MADNAQNTTENNANAQNTTENTDNSPPPTTVQKFLMDNKYDTLLWLIRLYMIFSTICFIVPILGAEFGAACFKRVLLGCAATSALRLHQRMPRIQFSVEFAKQLILEDSFHYFIYSVLFLMSSAATLVLIPIVIFAVMHSSSYTRKVIDVNPSNMNGLVIKLRQFIVKLETQELRQQMLMFIALTEIMVFALSILMVFSGKGTILVPFFYYRFLQLRYSSRRNPYSRMMFGQLRVGIQQAASHPRCPAIGQKILYGIISLALRFSPAQTPAAQ